jgi:tryptophan synthase alpha chain
VRWQAGGTLSASLDLIASVRHELRAAVVLFTYVNPVLRMGVDRFVDRAADAGVDGVLLLDLPIEESATMRDALDRPGDRSDFSRQPDDNGCPSERGRKTRPRLLYAISRLGVTGTRDAVAETAAPLVSRIRAFTSLPIALGFGISRPEHVTEVNAYADAAVVGSAIVQVIEKAVAEGRPAAPDVERFVTWLRTGQPV